MAIEVFHATTSQDAWKSQIWGFVPGGGGLSNSISLPGVQGSNYSMRSYWRRNPIRVKNLKCQTSGVRQPFRTFGMVVVHSIHCRNRATDGTSAVRRELSSVTTVESETSM